MKIPLKIKKIFSINNWVLWIFICLLSNSIFFYNNLQNLHIPAGDLYAIGGDAGQYIYSAENVYQGKEFTFFKTNDKDYIFLSNTALDYDKGIYYAFRTPGFAFLYLPLRLLFSFKYTLVIILLIQVLLSAIAKYVFAKLCLKLINKEVIFYSIIVLLNIAGYPVFYNNLFYTESFAFSFFVLSINFFLKFLESHNEKELLFSGLFFMEVVFLRPFMAIYYLFFIVVLYFNLKLKLRKYLFYLMVYSLPLITVESIWVIRNYIKTSTFIPLSKTKSENEFHNKAINEFQKLTESSGRTIEWWIKMSPMKWFMDSLDKRDPDLLLPNYIYPPAYNPDSIISAKKYYILSRDTMINRSIRTEYELRSANIIANINGYYKSHYPIRYYIVSRVRLLIDFINQPIVGASIPSNPFSILRIFVESLVCYFAFFWGSISLFLGIYNYRKNAKVMLFISIPIFIYVLFPIIMQFREWRELYLAFPFLLFSGVCSLAENKLKPFYKKIYISAVLIAVIFYAGYYTINVVNW
jgi:hypothetical protein